MPFYRFTADGLGSVLRSGLDNLRDGHVKLNRVKGILNQASDQDLVDIFGFANTTVAADAKAELLADIPSISVAVQQMFDQFG